MPIYAKSFTYPPSLTTTSNRNSGGGRDKTQSLAAGHKDRADAVEIFVEDAAYQETAVTKTGMLGVAGTAYKLLTLFIRFRSLLCLCTSWAIRSRLLTSRTTAKDGDDWADWVEWEGGELDCLMMKIYRG